MITLTAVGDIILTPGMEGRVRPDARGSLFEKVRPLLADADITFGNFEGSLSDRGAAEDKRKEFTLRASPAWAGVLKHAGFNVLCLANNHVLDYGPLAMDDTFRNLELQGIAHLGAGRDRAAACRPVMLDVRGMKIAFLAFTYSYSATARRPGCCPRNLGFVRKQVKAARRAVDFVVVSIHDGLEYVDYPSRELMTWFRGVADAGANLVLGHHPHVAQGVEIYNGALLCYSLGNFISDYSDEEVRRESYAKTAITYFGARPLAVSDLRTTETFILRCELAPGRIVAHSLTPIRTNEHFQVEPMGRQQADAFLERLERMSKAVVEPDARVLDEIDAVMAKSRALSLGRLTIKEVLASAHRIRPRHLKMLIPFLKSKLP